MPTSTGLKINQIPGVINSVTAHYKGVDDLNIATEYQFWIVDRLFKKEVYDVQEGNEVSYHITTDDKGNARHARYMEGRDFELRDPTIRGTAQWTKADAYAAWEKHAVLACKGKAKIKNLIKTEHFRSKAGALKVIEQRIVLAPDTADDDRNPPGLQYWMAGLAPGVVDYVGGFNGAYARFGNYSAGDATTYTTRIGGIDRLANPMVRNWAGNHNGMTQSTLEAVLRMCEYTNFQMPRDLQEFNSERQKKRYHVWPLRYRIEYMQLRNQIGVGGTRNADLSPFSGQGPEFNGISIMGLPTLDNVPLLPMYLVDFAYFYPIVHSDIWMDTDEAMNDRQQPDLFTQQINCWYSYLNDNPRLSGGVLHMPG